MNASSMKLILILLIAPSFLIIGGIGACSKSDSSQGNDDYWQVEDPRLQGFDLDRLQDGIEKASESPNFHALLVIRNNKLVVEEYFNNKSASDLFHIRSITKNFTSALTSVAIEEGLIDGLGSTIDAYFPELMLGIKGQITIANLLNMSSGLSWNENEEINELLENRIPNPVFTILGRALDSDPGTTFNYNTVSTHIVSHIISKTSNQPFEEYAEQKIFEPLQIKNYNWDRDPDGKVWGGTGLQLRPRDLAKFGQLYLNEGAWEGKRLISQEWVDLSQTTQINVPQFTSNYSLHWWVADNTSSKVYFGQGYGGQALMLIPDKNIVIIALQEFFVTSDQNDKQWSNFLTEVFVPIFESVN